MTREVTIRYNNEMGRTKELHEKESKFWQELKARYEENAASNMRKKSNLKSAPKELQARTDMSIEAGKLHVATSRRLNNGWDEWTK